jgi:hypothetical protein
MLALTILGATELNANALWVLQAFVPTLLQCFLAISPLPAMTDRHRPLVRLGPWLVSRTQINNPRCEAHHGLANARPS